MHPGQIGKIQPYKNSKLIQKVKRIDKVVEQTLEKMWSIEKC